MNNSIINALVEKNAFEVDTIVTAEYQTLDLFGRTFDKVGDFKVKKILKHENNVIFELLSLQDKDTKIIKREPKHILGVDGMDIKRFADVYGLTVEGVSKKYGKKRGRKPKTN